MWVCVLVANNSSKRGVVCLIPQELYPLLIPRKTQISIGELLAACLAVMHLTGFPRVRAVAWDEWW